jgi:hypothetical protein
MNLSFVDTIEHQRLRGEGRLHHGMGRSSLCMEIADMIVLRLHIVRELKSEGAFCEKYIFLCNYRTIYCFLQLMQDTTRFDTSGNMESFQFYGNI